MRQLTVVAMRALSKLFGQVVTALSFMAFLAAVGAFFADGIFAAEGTAVSASSIWALSVARALPLLASLLTMRLWSGDGVAERLESDLVVPVPERVFAQGRFAAAYAAVLCAIAMSLVLPLFILPWCSPALSTQLDIVRFIPAFAALAVFALPLTSIGSMAGVIFRNSVSAAVASAALTYAVPFAAYKALLSWNPAVRMKFAEAPVVSHIADAADGLFSFGAVVAAASFAFFALFAASKAFAMRRIACDGRICLKISSVFSMLLALTAATLLSLVAFRLDFKVEWPGAVRTASISARTREILSGISSPVRISVCMRRDSPEFVPASRLLRTVEAASRSCAGAGVTCEFVDPRWDPNAAVRLVRAGAGENSIVFSAERRRITVPVKDFDESSCASAIQRLSMPARLETVLFTTGHGEPSIDDFGPFGIGDAARALRQEGYRTGTHFSPTSSVPGDCAVLVVAGARTPFSTAELRDIGTFIAHGGRLLVTDSGDPEAGVKRILERLGMVEFPAGGDCGTTDGSNITVSDFGDHAVSIPLQGSAVMFAPGAHRFAVPASPPANGHGFSVTALCPPGALSYAVAVEKGAALRSDLAIRPARMVIIGDPSFFLNGTFASRANANRDFFLNAVAWLAGMDVSGAVDVADNILSVRMDRAKRIRFFLCSSVVVPLIAALILWTPVRRRRRKMR